MRFWLPGKSSAQASRTEAGFAVMVTLNHLMGQSQSHVPKGSMAMSPLFVLLALHSLDLVWPGFLFSLPASLLPKPSEALTYIANRGPNSTWLLSPGVHHSPCSSTHSQCHHPSFFRKFNCPGCTCDAGGNINSSVSAMCMRVVPPEVSGYLSTS